MGATAACVPLCGLTDSEGDRCHNPPPPFVTSSKRKGGWRSDSEEEAILVAPVCLFLPFLSLSQKDRKLRVELRKYKSQSSLSFYLRLCATLLSTAGPPKASLVCSLARRTGTKERA